MSPSSRRHSTASAVAALLVGVAAMVVAVIKAKVASITHDEAVTYALYVAGPWSRITENYTAGNHFLFTVLAKLSTLAFGASELTLRLPALLASCAFVFVLWKLLKLITRGWYVTLGMAAILLNPMTLDYLSMARGYSLSLAAFLIAVYLAIRGFALGFVPRRVLGIGASLGIAVAGNLTALIPAIGFAMALWILLATSRKSNAGLGFRPSLVVVLAAVSIPIGLAVLLHLTVMGWSIGPHHFWYGTTTLDRMLISFDQRSLFHEAPEPLVPVDEVPRGDVLSAVVSAVISPAMLLAVLVSALGAAIESRRRDHRPPAPSTHVLILSATTLVSTVACLWIANAALDVRYPRGRTGLCISVIMTLGVVSMIVESRTRGGRIFRIVGVGATAILIAFTVRYVTELELYRFGEAYCEARGRQNFEKLLTIKPAELRTPLRAIAQPPVYGPGADFYRLTRNATWMAPVDRVVEPGVRYDFVLADTRTASSALVRHYYREIARDADTGSVVLVAK